MKGHDDIIELLNDVLRASSRRSINTSSTPDLPETGATSVRQAVQRRVGR